MKMKRGKSLLSLLLSFALMISTVAAVLPSAAAASNEGDGFALFEGDALCTIINDGTLQPQVERALGDFETDIEAVTGKLPTEVSTAASAGKRAIIVGTAGAGGMIDALADAGKLDLTGVAGEWEAFTLRIIDNPVSGIDRALVIAGSDMRGTIYGIYEVSELIGVSPWHWWGDVPVNTSDEVIISKSAEKTEKPDVQYRGIFINDEENFEYWSRLQENDTDSPGTPNAGTYEKIYELLLRLKANSLWPAMHELSDAFNKYIDPETGTSYNAEKADEYGIIAGSSHCEMLLRNNASEWVPWCESHVGQYNLQKVNNDWNSSYDYTVNATAMNAYWEEAVARNYKFENMYTIGLRGVHDAGINCSNLSDKSIAGKASVVKKAIEAQVAILNKYEAIYEQETGIHKDFLKVYCSYKEAADYFQYDISLPQDTVIIWGDDNYSYVREVGTASELEKFPNQGIYYHVSYLGTPISYLWTASTSLNLIYEEMTKAYNSGSNDVWILNVGDLKPAEIPMDFLMGMAWDHDKYNDETIGDYLANFASKSFSLSDSDSAAVAEILKTYYEVASVKKPEAYGKNLGFDYSVVNYGDEAQIQLNKISAACEESQRVYDALPENEKDAYYQLVHYMLTALRDTMEKTFYQQKNQLYVAQGRFASVNAYAKASEDAYQRILNNLKYYNKTVSGGRWDGILDPYNGTRNLPAISGAPDVTYLSENSAVEGVGSVCEGQSSGGESITLNFNSLTKDSHFIDVFNTGLHENSYTITCDPSIILKKTDGTVLKGTLSGGKTVYSGTVSVETRLLVSVDWSKISASADSAITVADAFGSSKSYPVSITKSAVDPEAQSALGHDGYYVINGEATIEAENYSASISNNGLYWDKVEGLGRNGSAVMKNYPDLSSESVRVDTDYDNSTAYLQYDVYFEETGTYELSFYRLPTLNEGTNKTNRTAMRFDSGSIFLFRGNSAVSDEFGNATWRNGVMNNVDILTNNISVSTAGWHTIKIYRADAGTAFDKLTLRKSTVSAKSSALGAPSGFTTTADYTAPSIGIPPEFSLDDIIYGEASGKTKIMLDFSADAGTASSGYTGADNHTAALSSVGMSWGEGSLANIKGITRTISSGVCVRDQGFIYSESAATLNFKLPSAGKYVVSFAVGDRQSGGVSAKNMAVSANNKALFSGLNVTAGRTVEQGYVVDCTEASLSLTFSGSWVLTALEIANYNEPETNGGNGAFVADASGNINIEAETSLEQSDYAKYTPGTDSDKSSWTEVFGTSGTAMYSGPNKGNNFSNTAIGSNSGPKMYYTINFPETGSYNVYLLAKSQADVDDSVLVSLDGATAAVLNDTKDTGGKFAWFKLGSQITVSSAGNHTLSLWEREDGITIDKIVVTKGSAPADNGEKMCREGAPVDRSELNSLIASAKALNKSDYLQDQFSVVTAALANAEKVGANAAQDEIDSACAQLKKAIDALVDPSVINADITTGLVGKYTFDSTWTNAINSAETAVASTAGTTKLPEFSADAELGRVVRVYGGGTGNSSKISVPNPMYKSDIDGITVSFKVKGVSLDTYGCLLTATDKINYTWLTGGAYFGYSGSRGYIDLNKDGSFATLSNDVWYTLTLTVTENESVIYINGKKAASTLDGAKGYNTSDLSRVVDLLRQAQTLDLGGHTASWGSGAFYADDLMVFNRALSEGETAKLALNIVNKTPLIDAIAEADAEAAKTDIYLPDSILAFKAEIEKARAVVYSSSATEKNVVDAVAALRAAKSLLKTNDSEKTAAEKVAASIAALPGSSAVVSTDSDAIYTARAAYEALSDYGKSIVGDISRLESAEKQLLVISGNAGIGNLVCNDTDNDFNWTIRTGLKNNEQAYGDRKVYFKTLPSHLVGCDWIRTSMNSKLWDSGTNLCEFDVYATTYLYVGWDNYVATPDWLGEKSEFEKTTETISFDGTDSVLQLYRRKVYAGEHVKLGILGQNRACYLVFLENSTAAKPEQVLPTKELSRTVKVACVGDSITYGSGSSDRNTTAYPARLGQMLGSSYDVRNFGLGGTTLINSTDKPYTSQTEYTQSLAYNPDIVIIMLGTNDSKPKNSGKIAAEYERDYLALIETYKNLSSNPKIYIATSPFCPNNPASPGSNDIIGSVIADTIVPLQKKIAEKSGLELIDMNKATYKLSIFADSVHPNDEGYTIVAKNFYNALFDYIPDGVRVLNDKPVYTELDAALADAKAVNISKYSAGTAAALTAAINAAESINRNTLTSADQLKVNSLTADIISAKAALVIKGDIDADGKVSVSDVVSLRKIILSGSWSVYEKEAADLDSNGLLTVSDVVELRKYIMSGV